MAEQKLNYEDVPGYKELMENLSTSKKDMLRDMLLDNPLPGINTPLAISRKAAFAIISEMGEQLANAVGRGVLAARRNNIASNLRENLTNEVGVIPDSILSNVRDIELRRAIGDEGTTLARYWPDDPEKLPTKGVIEFATNMLYKPGTIVHEMTHAGQYYPFDRPTGRIGSELQLTKLMHLIDKMQITAHGVPVKSAPIERMAYKMGDRFIREQGGMKFEAAYMETLVKTLKETAPKTIQDHTMAKDLYGLLIKALAK